MKATAIAAGLLVGGVMLCARSAEFEPITVPLLDDEVALRVPVNMFGEAEFFMIDTGASATALDVRYRERLGTPIRQWDGQDFYRSPEIKLGNVRLALDEVFCADLKMFRLIMGKPCDGILGMDFLRDRVVELDFDRGLVIITRKLQAQALTNTWRIPMKLSNNRHFRVPTLINGKVEMDLLLDTGDSSMISLKEEDWHLVFPPARGAPVHKLLLAGVGQHVSESLLARLASLEVQSCNYSNVLCVLNRYHTAPSALGMEFFRRHRVTFDFPNETLYLQPRSCFNDVAEHDMSGLHLLHQDGAVLVHSVDEGSPAARAGLRPGDILASLNGRSAADLTLTAFRRALRAGDGVLIRLDIERGERTVSAELVLKRAL